MKWKIGTIHPEYGTVGAVGCKEGESYRMFIKNGSVSFIPLSCLEEEKGD